MATLIDVLNEIAPPNNGFEWTIYRWSEGEHIAELDYAKPMVGGSSFMASDIPHGLAACAAAERVETALRVGYPELIEETVADLRAAMGLEDE